MMKHKYTKNEYKLKYNMQKKKNEYKLKKYIHQKMNIKLRLCIQYFWLLPIALFDFLKQGYPYHKLRKTFSKFYHWHYELISKFNVEHLPRGLSEPEFYGDLVYILVSDCRFGVSPVNYPDKIFKKM